MQFHKYHALGNDYIVINPENDLCRLDSRAIQLICHRNFGIGSDGILLGPLPIQGERPQDDECASFRVRIFNPDGSEAEKSGNGLRIFSRYLWDKKLVQDVPFRVQTVGGWVKCSVAGNGCLVTVDMGRVSFTSDSIPVTGPAREVLNEPITVQGHSLHFNAATVGNPHCVIIKPEISAEETRALGPDLEVDTRFPNRTNVQFVKILDRNNIQVEIWERGAGYTLASGSSASACAGVVKRLGYCDDKIAVHMPGGDLQIKISDDYDINMVGPVTAVAEGKVAEDLYVELNADSFQSNHY